MKLKRALLLCLIIAMACHMQAAFAEPAAGIIIAGDSETSSDTGIVAQRASATSNHLVISETTSSDQNESFGTKSLTFKLPSGTKTESVKIVLNGRVVTSRFHAASCSGASCQVGVLSSEDGLRPGKNVLYVVGKAQDGTAVSSRLRFAGIDAQASKRTITGLSDFVSERPASTQPLPTASSFLPPTISLSTIRADGGIAGQPWLQLGTQTQLSAAANCTGYTVTVLDRQTLVEKTSAPESSPSCQTNGIALFTYLKGLSANDLVIVGTTFGFDSDAGGIAGQLNTGPIGGSAYNCDPNVPMGLCVFTSSRSKDIPISYIAIGAVGAAPGSAYENYQTSTEQPIPDDSYFYSNSHGMLTEDANGNYNFQNSWAVEYVVSPGTAPGGASVAVTNTPIYQSSKVVYRPPTGTNGFWVLGLSRNSLRAYGEDNGTCEASSSSPAGEIDFDNCGTFYQTGPGVDAATLAANYKTLAQTLTGPPIDRRALIIVTTVGTPVQGSVWDVANNNANSSWGNGTWHDSGYYELALAFRQLGIPDTTVLSLGGDNSAFTYITSPGLGNSLSGQSVLSSTAYAPQGQSGYVHGLFTRDLKGLYRPGHSEQQTSGSDYSNFTMGLVSSYTPVDWPELASQMSGTDSFAGQKAAYAYLSWYLLNAWYVQSEYGAQGVPAPYAYDIHYFFTGSLNTFIDYHSFDPTNAVWPGTPGFSGGWNHPCSSPGSTCTWTSPLDGTTLTFTQNDFNAVKTQLHNEVVDLTNVLLFMVNGSTNMKDIIAAGNSNVALTLISAASTISANLNEPPPATPATVSAQNVVSMVGSGLTTLAGIGTLLGGPEASAGITVINSLVDVTADIFSDVAGAGGGFTNAGSSALPSPDSVLNTTIGQLANSDLQDSLLAGFDTTLDTITGDWGKLSEIGPLVTDPTNKAFYSPNQVAQNIVIGLMTQASQRSLYLSLLPSFYRVQYWPQVYSQSMTATNSPDMGYTSSGDYNSCHAFYTDGYNPPAANVSAWYPSIGGVTYNGGVPFTPNDYSFNPIDYYVLALPFGSVGASDTYAHYVAPQLANLLFGTQQGALNFPFDVFVAHSGPMDWRLDGQGSSFEDLSIESPSSGQNLTGHNNGNICSVAQLSSGLSSQQGGGTNGPTPSSTTTLNAPGSAILGEGVPLQVSVTPASGSGPAPSGTVQFRDGSTVLSIVALDSTGSAGFTATGLQIGPHTLSAYYISNGTYEASNSPVNALTVYANAPDIALSLSVDTLNITNGTTSSAVTLNVNSQSGMAGTLNFSCTGLPAGMSCNFNPAKAAISAGGKVSTSFTITSTAPRSSAMLSAKGIGALLVPFSLWYLWGISKGRRYMYRAMSLLLLSVISIACVMGCGGDSKAQTNQDSGAKTILVNASDGSLTRTVPLLVNIQ